MLGFVSALSSTLAIVVLISSVLLVNLLTFSIKKSEKEFEIKITDQFNQNDNSENELKRIGKTGDEGNDKGQVDTMVSKYVLSAKELPSRNAPISKVSIGCSYGNNFSYDVASKLSSINYIILAKNFSGTNVAVVMEKPLYEENGVNDCWVNTDNGRK